MMISKLANVHSGAKVADDVVVEPFATIYEDVEIGSGCWIGPNVVIMNGARIGKNVKIFPGCCNLRRSTGYEIRGGIYHCRNWRQYHYS